VEKGAMEMLTGKFNVTLDEKGRIILPAHLRRILNEEKLYITECKEDKCLWLYPLGAYNKRLEEIQNNTDPLLNREDRLVRRQFFDALPVDITNSGRVPIAQNYREFAGLSKDCLVMGRGDYIEVWDEERYAKSSADTEEDSIAASEKLGNTLKSKRGINV
jgi:MraZ protein